jgi:hypothetical protein
MRTDRNHNLLRKLLGLFDAEPKKPVIGGTKIDDSGDLDHLRSAYLN